MTQFLSNESTERCPITNALFTDLKKSGNLTSTSCGHKFSKIALEDWMGFSNKCPTCSSPFTVINTANDLATQSFSSNNRVKRRNALSDNDSDDEQMEKAIQVSLRENYAVSNPNKKYKSSQSSSVFEPVEPAQGVQDAITPGVLANRSLKRKASNEIAPEPEPTNRIDAVFRFLFGLPKGIVDIMLSYDSDTLNDIIAIIQQGNEPPEDVKRLAGQVTVLNLREYPETIKTEDLARIFNYFNKVSILYSKLFSYSDENVIAQFGNLKPVLRELNIENYGNGKCNDYCRYAFTNDDLDNFAQFENLERLNLSNNDRGFDATKLANLKKLKELNLENVKYIYNDSLAHLPPLLTSLNIKGANNENATISTVGFSHLLKNLQFLQSLSLSNCDITGDGIDSLTELQHLNSLDLSDCRLTDELLAKLADFPALRSLSLKGCTGCTAAGILALAKLKDLSSLNLSGWSFNMTSDVIDSLQNFPELESLDLSSGLSLTHTDLEKLSSLKKLKSLNLNNCHTIYDGISHLAKLPDLQSFYLNGWFSRDSLFSLPQINNFRELDIRGMDITDDDLVTLASSENLKKLDIKLCGLITRYGIAKAKEINPSLEIKYY